MINHIKILSNNLNYILIAAHISLINIAYRYNITKEYVKKLDAAFIVPLFQIIKNKNRINFKNIYYSLTPSEF